MNKENVEGVRVVFPGMEIIDSLDVMPGNGVYRDGSKLYSKFVGVVKKKGSIISVAPLSGVYMPNVGDVVIGEVVEVGFSHWTVDIKAPYDAQLSTYDVKTYVEKNADLTRYLDKGDIIFAKVIKVTKSKYVYISTKESPVNKLVGGYVTNISAGKVPRLIGKSGSMISMIKEKTKCNIFVGQNGLVWIKGDNEDVAAKAVWMIEKYSTVSGLTDKIQEFLDKELKQ